MSIELDQIDTNSYELTTREIVTLLLSDKKVTMEFQCYLDFVNLLSNLNVEKSRKRKANEEFGLDFENKIIKTHPNRIETFGSLDKISPFIVTFYCSVPILARKYSVFKIED